MFIKFFQSLFVVMILLVVLLKAEILGVPSEYTSIQEAINASSLYDTVLVAKGTYYENIIINQDVVLTSNFAFDRDSSDIDETIIDGNLSGSVIDLGINISNKCVIQFLTIRNGMAENGAGINTSGNPIILGNTIENNKAVTGKGGGVNAISYSNSAIIYKNIIRNNSASDGGGIFAYKSQLIVENEIYENFASSHGGGVWVADNIVRGNLFYENTCSGDGAAIYIYYGDSEIRNNIIIKNDGDGIYLYGAEVPKTSSYWYNNFFINNTIYGNSGNGIIINALPKTVSVITNNIIWNNQVNYIPNSSAEFEYNNIYNFNDDNGNISVLPQFEDTLNNNYQLKNGSSGIDQGSPDSVFYDHCFPPSKGNQRNDMGAYGGPFACLYQSPVAEITGIKFSNRYYTKNYYLSQNYPNPFNNSTVISYQLAINGKVTLKIYDISGRELKTLVNKVQNAGKHSVSFNAENLASGVYLYRLTTSAGYSQNRKMILIK